MECIASQLVMNQPFYAFTGLVQRRGTLRTDPVLTGEPLPVRDGYVALQGNTFIPMSDIADLFGDPRLHDPEFATSAGRQRHYQRLRDLLAENVAGESGVEFFTRTCSRGLLAGVVQDASQLLGCEHLAARDHFHASPDLSAVDGTPLRFSARLVNLSATPSSVRRGSPACGEHTEAILSEMASAPRGAAREDPAPRSSAETPGPLAGLRVIDLSALFAVPYMGGLLADLGADVIKVESPRRLDQSRAGYGATYENNPGPQFWNRANTFEVLNRGKRDVCIDLRSAAGQDLLRRLAATADVILDNFTPRVLRKWNLTFAELSRINPRLIMLSSTGYGSSGPWSAFKSQGTTLEATMGWMHYTGYPDGPPSKAGQSAPDFLAAWTGLLALMVALAHRERTGEGQRIDLGMYQLGPCVIPEALLGAQLGAAEFRRRGAQDIDAVLSGVFPTSEEERWVAISVPDADGMRLLASAIPPVASSIDASGRLAPGGAEQARRAIAEWTSAITADDAAARLQRSGIAAGPVADAATMIRDPQLAHRRFYEWVDFDQDVGVRPLIGRPYRWTGATAVRIRGAASRFAADNDAVLGDAARLSADEIARLRRDRVVFDEPADPPPPPPPYDFAAMAAAGTARVETGYHQTLEAARKTSEERQMNSYPTVHLNESAMREGMQIESVTISVADKIRLLNELSETGIEQIEVGSFVSPRYTPQMEHIDEVLGGFIPKPGVRYTAIVLNQKGRERRAKWMPPLSEAPMPSSLMTHLCDTFVRRNTNRSRETEVEAWPAVVAAAQEAGAREAGIMIGAAFGSNFEGPFSLDDRMSVFRQQHAMWDEAGIPVTWLGMADPMSWCMPNWVGAQLEAVLAEWPDIRNFYLHLHDGRGMALPSIYAALEVLDERHAVYIDVTAGGVGGCPYCGNGRATGMAPTEDVVHMLETMGIPTGVDLPKLIEAVHLLEEIIGRPAMGHVSKAGPRPGLDELYDPNLPLIETHEDALFFMRGEDSIASDLRPWREPIPAPAPRA